uniref:Uncharacterized protein n=1 Tax=viral metagenome TaxID=1070528 RepID=A0A6C0JTT7_9ZZZZ
MSYDSKLSAFLDFCEIAGLYEMQKYLSNNKEAETMILKHGTEYCCALKYCLRLRIITLVEYFLTFVNVIPLDIIEGFFYHHAFKKVDIDILKILLAHGKFEKDISDIKFTARDDLIFRQCQSLLNEYKFRLDGPVYNENVLL